MDIEVSNSLNVNPLIEEVLNYGSYVYAFNNPINFVDPDGNKPLDWYRNNITGNIQWFKGSGTKSNHFLFNEKSGALSTGLQYKINASSGVNYGVTKSNRLF